MPRKKKIKSLGKKAEGMVAEQAAEGKSYRDIAESVSNTFNTDVSYAAVRNYLKNHVGERMKEMGARNAKEVKKKEVEQLIEVGGRLKELDKKLNTALDTLNEKDRQDMGILIKLSKEIRKTLKFHKEYIENITQPDTQINIDKSEQAVQIVNKLSELEEEGIITIHKPEKL